MAGSGAPARVLVVCIRFVSLKGDSSLFTNKLKLMHRSSKLIKYSDLITQVLSFV